MLKLFVNQTFNWLQLDPVSHSKVTNVQYRFISVQYVVYIHFEFNDQ